MKKNTPYLIAPVLLLFIIILLFSCKKHNSTSAGPIVQKWNIIRHIDTFDHFIGPASYLDYKGTAGDYMDFRSDGNLYHSENNLKDSFTYTVNKDTLFAQIHAGTFVYVWKIEVLTADSLQLHNLNTFQLNSHDWDYNHYYLHK